MLIVKQEEGDGTREEFEPGEDREGEQSECAPRKKDPSTLLPVDRREQPRNESHDTDDDYRQRRDQAERDVASGEIVNGRGRMGHGTDGDDERQQQELAADRKAGNAA